MDNFLDKIPAFSGTRILLLPIFVILIITANLSILRLFDLWPAIGPSTGILVVLLPWFPVIGVILMEFIGMLLIYLIFSRKDKLKKKYPYLSYQKIFFSGFGGVAIILSLAVHNYISISTWQGPLWRSFPYQIFTLPLAALFANFAYFFRYLGVIFAIFLFLLGILMVYRAIQIFGFDYMAVVYLYFPEESELQDHQVYSLLRHPAYAGGILICLGGVLLQQNLYSLIFFLVFYVGFYIHIHFVEEKELIQRFGESYIEYRNEVPAFFVKPKNYFRFLKLIIRKST